MNGTGQFLVEILYREPGYEARHGPREQPYRWRYAVSASSPATAEGMALAEFKTIASLSSVGWIREVVAVHISTVN